jgi:hypothetical protein
MFLSAAAAAIHALSGRFACPSANTSAFRIRPGSGTATLVGICRFRFHNLRSSDEAALELALRHAIVQTVKIATTPTTASSAPTTTAPTPTPSAGWFAVLAHGVLTELHNT